MVLACQVGGRWSDETRDCLRHLAKAKVRWELFRVQPRLLGSALVCSAAKVFAQSLFQARSWVSSDGCIPLTGEVIGDARYVPVGELAAGSVW